MSLHLRRKRPGYILLVLLMLYLPAILHAVEQDDATASPEVSSLLEQGRSLLEMDQPERALEKLRAAQELDEGNPVAHYLTGMAYIKQGDNVSAIESFHQTIVLDPTHVEARRQLALYYEAHDQLDLAIVEYSGIVQWSEPDSDFTRSIIKKIRYLTATQHAKQNNIDAALDIFGELAAEYPGDALIAYSTGVAYMLKGRMDDARLMYERTLRIDPAYLNAYMNLATIDETQGAVDAAVANLTHVVELSPDSAVADKANARLNIIEARILTQEGNLQDAVSAYERALEYDPSNGLALRSRADLYRRMNDVDGERKAFEKLVAQQPGDFSARNRLAELYLAGKQYTLAYEQLDAVLESRKGGSQEEIARKLLAVVLATAEGKQIDRTKALERLASLERSVIEDPENTGKLRDLAVMYFKLDRYEDSSDALESLVRLAPEDTAARFSLAGLRDRLGQFEESVRGYLWLISHAQDETTASRYVVAMKLVNAKRLFVSGDIQRAGREFSEILAEDPANSLANFYLGLIYSREDDIAGAVDAYKEVVRQVPTHVGARLNLAYSYERLNREEDAIDEYRKILQANPSDEMAETVRRRLRNLQKRINGLTAGVGYLIAYDSNSNLSDTQIAEELRSDLSLNLSYQYKTERGYRWRLSAQPAYSNYHEGQYDFLNSSETIAVSAIRDARTLVGGYSYRTTDGILIDSRLSRTHTLFSELLSRVRLPNLLNPAGNRVPSSVTLSLSYSDFDSSSSPFFSSYTSAAGVAVSQPVTSLNTVRLGYSYVHNENKELVGSDYAYSSHGLSAGLDHFMPWGSVNLNLGLTLFNYANLDSFSQFTERRRNVRSNLALGATYRYRPDINLFATLAWTDNRSNLPVGFILNSEDIIEGQQSSSLSDYRRTVLTTGINLRF
jgi:tetratricopeptide (TPR) repeat protein